MRLQAVALAVAASASFFVAAPRAADCDAVGDIEFICGQSGPEDLARRGLSPRVGRRTTAGFA